MHSFSLAVRYIDLEKNEIFPAIVEVNNGKIIGINKAEVPSDAPLLMPGFVDAHVHIESSMLLPAEFARIAVTHGTLATVSDPHEIANVLGVKGVEYMLENAAKTPMLIAFGAPSCVPATNFETAGAHLDPDAVEQLLQRDDIYYLTEMMNFPGVVYDDQEVLAKIKLAHHYNKPVDGHAPGLSGDALKKYVDAGISTDHECFTLAEAEEKLALGMKILIREGSAAKNLDALLPLFDNPAYQDKLMFCSDDKHPDSLVVGHVNLLVKRALEAKKNLFAVLRAASINAIHHYKLPIGQARVGENADFILIKDFETMECLATYKAGELLAKEGKSTLNYISETPINAFAYRPVAIAEIQVQTSSENSSVQVKCIEALNGQLITNSIISTLPVINGIVQSDPSQDVLKMVCINRYSHSKAAIAYIKNFGLQAGAIGSTVAHDSHNIIVVGVDDASILASINQLMESQGGVNVVSNGDVYALPLPLAGLMSTEPAEIVATQYAKLDLLAKELGSKLDAPFMTLSFMALLVIPHLKLSDKGLFDGDSFNFTNLIITE
ncbi:MAG: adenine deaminase [Chitinophagales bacterium]|nr:adenine deaminase [Chitinophagales bacterium]